MASVRLCEGPRWAPEDKECHEILVGLAVVRAVSGKVFPKANRLPHYPLSRR